MSELLPCPFCGGEAETELCGKDQFAHWTVWCDCGVLRQDYMTEAEAIEAWNTRAERTCQLITTNTEAGYGKYCSECETRFHIEAVFNYCPNCGAEVV